MGQGEIFYFFAIKIKKYISYIIYIHNHFYNYIYKGEYIISAIKKMYTEKKIILFKIKV